MYAARRILSTDVILIAEAGTSSVGFGIFANE